MSSTEWVSVLIAVVALVVSFASVSMSYLQTQRLGKALLEQTRQTAQALALQQESERNTILLQFVTRYFDLMREGGIFKKLGDPEWDYRLWSLHASEFYFYHYGLLPVPMYTLWMTEIAEPYSHPTVGAQVHESHSKYLRTYADTYPEMKAFFIELYQIAATCPDTPTRNIKTAQHVNAWIGEHRVRLAG